MSSKSIMPGHESRKITRNLLITKKQLLSVQLVNFKFYQMNKTPYMKYVKHGHSLKQRHGGTGGDRVPTQSMLFTEVLCHYLIQGHVIVSLTF